MNEPIARLIAAWGQPSDMFKLPGGHVVVEYRHKNILHVFQPIMPLLPYDRATRPEPSLVRAASTHGAPYHSQRAAPRRNRLYLAVSCVTSFITDERQMIRGWEFKGDNCISLPPPNSEVPANLATCRVQQNHGANIFLTTAAECARVGGTVQRR